MSRTFERLSAINDFAIAYSENILNVPVHNATKFNSWCFEKSISKITCNIVNFI